MRAQPGRPQQRGASLRPITDTLVHGRYDLQLRRDRFQGGFSEPLCLLCTRANTADLLNELA